MRLAAAKTLRGTIPFVLVRVDVIVAVDTLVAVETLVAAEVLVAVEMLVAIEVLVAVVDTVVVLGPPPPRAKYPASAASTITTSAKTPAIALAIPRDLLSRCMSVMQSIA